MSVYMCQPEQYVYIIHDRKCGFTCQNDEYGHSCQLMGYHDHDVTDMSLSSSRSEERCTLKVCLQDVKCFNTSGVSHYACNVVFHRWHIKSLHKE